MILLEFKFEAHSLMGDCYSAKFQIGEHVWKRYWIKGSVFCLYWKNVVTFSYPLINTNQYEELEGMFNAFIFEDSIKEVLELPLKHLTFS